ncbi:hypothetical protein LG71_03925 [Pluralibacter gergoviae]|uniref:hypothetical protein n=1 Tax=Pluralibacter gergoviae TaxID=61647 RepID=UPI0004F7E6BA|nr:hypothetical protein [Pluralibacter gergoviae]AIQ99106.1 hypothetical protein LG71_03925 [Pluralibacter gergoviae]
MKVLLAGTALLLSGCATLVGEDEERIYIDSEPARSTFIITDDSGRIAGSGTTPQSVTLKKADGSYFGGIRYTLALSSPGYSSELVPLRTRYSHWYTFGNLVFLGFPGWLAVDPFSGGMYTFRQHNIHLQLRPCPRGPWFFTCV